MTDDNARVNAQAEWAKAQAARRAAQALAEIGLFDDASSRPYYAAFHLASAALLTHGVQAQSHGGVASLLGQHLVRPGLLPNLVAREFASLMSLRSQADYNRHFVMDAEGLAAATRSADSLFPPLEAYPIWSGVA